MLKKKDYKAYLYLLPAFLLMSVFILYPVVSTLITSFKENYRFLTGSFVRFSIDNYKDILMDETFQKALVNTSFIAFICVPFSMLTSLVVALLLNSIKKLQGLFMTLFYLPQVTNVIAAGMVFALIFNNNFGLMNLFLGLFGVDPVQWISGIGIAASKELYNQSYLRCLFVLFIYSTWSGLSLKVVLFLGGLQNIRRDYYQAARLDGTSSWKTLKKITLPLLSPTTFYVFITSVITAFKAYSAVVALFTTAYGPAGDNTKMMITIVGYIIDSLGSYLTAGAVSVASAAAVILMIIIMILTALQFKASKRWVHYK
ncbi:MAG: sugar ABC transporter permease [Spirochaetae bacterium HGW-Spirochaetae-8]|jgi:multiple sugar transport system permease protein|nr:MAG: sugar ABC transporter permease [Spirochaetae bacterium HGW-Spirochaetae-8]